MIRIHYDRYLWLVVAVNVDDLGKVTVGYGVTQGMARRHLFVRMGV